MEPANFEMTVSDVFVLAKRGTVAVGTPVRGQFRSGEVVQIWHGTELLGCSVAHVELHVRPGTVALLLTAPNIPVRAGYSITSKP